MKKDTLRLLFLGIVLPALAYLGLRVIFVTPAPPSALERLGIDPATVNPDTLPPKIAAELGLITRRVTSEYVVVVISSSVCPASATEGFDDAVGRIRSLVKDQLNARPEAVERLVGVAIDADPVIGSKYLAALGGFDEIATGGGWLNTATEKYIWGAHAVRGVTPQVVLLERSVQYADGGTPIVDGERITRVISGAYEIIEWVSDGAPLTPLGPAPSG